MVKSTKLDEKVPGKLGGSVSCTVVLVYLDVWSIKVSPAAYASHFAWHWPNI